VDITGDFSPVSFSHEALEFSEAMGPQIASIFGNHE